MSYLPPPEEQFYKPHERADRREGWAREKLKQMEEGVRAGLLAVLQGENVDFEQVIELFQNTLIQQGRRTAEDEHRQKRPLGRDNDDWCEKKGCGVRLYVTEDGMKGLIDNGIFESAHFSCVTDGCWMLDAEKWWYSAGGGGIQFFRAYLQDTWTNLQSFSMPYHQVVRIEAKDNSFWQNARIGVPDGEGEKPGEEG